MKCTFKLDNIIDEDKTSDDSDIYEKDNPFELIYDTTTNEFFLKVSYREYKYNINEFLEMNEMLKSIIEKEKTNNG